MGWNIIGPARSRKAAMTRFICQGRTQPKEDGGDVYVRAKPWHEYGSTSATWAIPYSICSCNYSCEFAFSTFSSLLNMFIALLVWPHTCNLFTYHVYCFACMTSHMQSLLLYAESIGSFEWCASSWATTTAGVGVGHLVNGTTRLMFIVHGTWRYLDLHLWFTCGCTWIIWFTCCTCDLVMHLNMWYMCDICVICEICVI
jgi:hypothetical protein